MAESKYQMRIMYLLLLVLSVHNHKSISDVLSYILIFVVLKIEAPYLLRHIAPIFCC